MTWTIRRKNTTYHFNQGPAPGFLIIDDSMHRIREFSAKFSDVEPIENKRFEMYQGTYMGKRVLLAATHMTAGNTAIVVDQMIDAGTRYIFKCGTYSGLQGNVKLGDLFIPTGAVRSEGLTDAYAPIYYPAIPDFELVERVRAHVGKTPVHTGIIHSVNIYSPYYAKTLNPDKYDPLLYRNIGVLGCEMEVSTTYTIAGVRGAKAVALLVCSRDWKTQEAAIKGKRVEWRNARNEEIVRLAQERVIAIILDTIASFP